MSLRLEIMRDMPSLCFAGLTSPSDGPTDPGGEDNNYGFLDLSTAVHMRAGGGTGAPYSLYDTTTGLEDVIIGNGTSWPEFYFPDLQLDRTKTYIFTFICDETHYKDLGYRGLWMGMLDDTDPWDDYYNGDYNWDVPWNSDDHDDIYGDTYSVTITPADWGDTSAFRNTPIFDTHRNSAISAIFYSEVGAWATLDLTKATVGVYDGEEYGQNVDGVISKSSNGNSASFYWSGHAFDNKYNWEFEYTFDTPLSTGSHHYNIGRYYDNSEYEWGNGINYQQAFGDHSWPVHSVIIGPDGLIPANWNAAADEEYNGYWFDLDVHDVLVGMRVKYIPPTPIEYGEWQTLDLSDAVFWTSGGHTYGQYSGGDIIPGPTGGQPVFHFPGFMLDRTKHYEFELTQTGPNGYFGMMWAQSGSAMFSDVSELYYYYPPETVVTLSIGPGIREWDDYYGQTVVRFDAPNAHAIRYREEL